MRSVVWSVVLMTGALSIRAVSAEEGAFRSSPVRKDLRAAVTDGKANELAPVPGLDRLGGGIVKKTAPTVGLAFDTTLFVTLGEPKRAAVFSPSLSALLTQGVAAPKPMVATPPLGLKPNVLQWDAGAVAPLLSGATLKERALSPPDLFDAATRIGLLAVAVQTPVDARGAAQGKRRR